MRVASALLFSLFAFAQFFALAQLTVWEINQIIYRSIMVMVTLLIGFLVTFSIPQTKKIIVSYERNEVDEIEDEEKAKEAV